MTQMPMRPAETAPEARNRFAATPGQDARQKRYRKRARRHALDRVMWTATGAALGAGLIVITTYLMIGDWL